MTVFDTEVCADLGSAGGHCAHTLTDATRDIPKPQWDIERVGYLCMNSTSFNDIETAVDQLCTTTGLCDYQTREALNLAFFRIKSLKAKK